MHKKVIVMFIILGSFVYGITFDDAYSEFLNYNLSIKQYFLKKDQKKLQVWQSFGQLLPQVSLVAQREHNDLDGSRQASALTDFEESLINNAPTNVRRVKLSLSQVLFDMSVYDDLTLKINGGSTIQS